MDVKKFLFARFGNRYRMRILHIEKGAGRDVEKGVEMDGEKGVEKGVERGVEKGVERDAGRDVMSQLAKVV